MGLIRLAIHLSPDLAYCSGPDPEPGLSPDP
jgi:hypothetical protein